MDEVNVVICDDIKCFAKRHSSETISDSVNCPGEAAEKAAASVRHLSTDEAVVVVRSASSSRACQSSKVKIKRKFVHRLFDPSGIDQFARKYSSKDFELVCKWLAAHQNVQPLVQLHFRRTRFVGLMNSATRGIWATLDKEVSMRSCSLELLASDSGFKTVSEEGENSPNSFPHAILEVRTEGILDTDIVAALDASHLVMAMP